MSYKISPAATTTILNHALTHPSSSVHGFLLGSAPTDIIAAVPLCHSPLTAPLLAAGLEVADRQFCGGSETRRIVGYYYASESASEGVATAPVLRAVESIGRIGGAVLLVVSNKKVSEGGQFLTAYEKDKNGRYLKNVEEGVEGGGGTVLDEKVFDFEDMMEGEGDWRNAGIAN